MYRLPLYNMQFHSNPTEWHRRMTPIMVTEMFIPEAGELATALQNGLRQHFAEATVEWVDCPDLTQEPFNLAAPGLCGSAALLEVGHMSYLFPRPHMNLYSMKTFLTETYWNHKNVSVIGAGICPRESNDQLGELIMNASLSRRSEDFLEVRNRSCLAYQDGETKKCALEPVIDYDLKCYPHGNFFVSQGMPGQVLKVQAKKRVNSSFLEALQSTLDCHSFPNDPSKLVGLGGTFLIKNAKARHHVLPYSWDAPLIRPLDICNWLLYFDLDAPLVAMGTLISSDRNYTNICQNSVGQAYGLTESHFHAISYSGAGGHFYTDVGSNDTVEYLGYFYPAEIFYHVNPPAKNERLLNFSDIIHTHC